MNIFVTSSDPYECARYLDDKRVIKMVLETTQLLSNASYIYGFEQGQVYSQTHMKHPCTLWAAENISHARWLFNHYSALCLEYRRRYNKVHACERFHGVFKQLFDRPAEEPTYFVNCTPYKDMSVHEAYELTLGQKWHNDKRRPTWYGNSEGPDNVK